MDNTSICRNYLKSLILKDCENNQRSQIGTTSSYAGYIFNRFVQDIAILTNNTTELQNRLRVRFVV